MRIAQIAVTICGIPMTNKRQARRFDFGELRAATRTPQGFLMCPGFATRCGVFPYKDAKGAIRRELRHPDDVLDPESLKTLKFAPVTIDHPPVMITPENVEEYSKGHTGDRVEVNRDLVDVDLIVQSQDAIDAVEKNGMRELSSGYDADIVEESGVYNGTPYDYRQKNIRYNHVAIVKRGRAGPEVRLRLDSADAVQQGEDMTPSEAIFSQESGVTDAEEGEASTKKVVILGREVDLPSDVADTIQDLLDRFDEMRAKQSLMEEEMSTKSRKDNKDVDISQPGVSPQVKVEQQTPDGRKAPGKTPAQPGTITGPVGKADDEEEKEDGEEDEKKKEDGDEHGVIGGETKLGKADDAPIEGKGGGGMESPLDLLRKDMEGLQKKMDAYAAASMDKPEQKPSGEKMDAADIEIRIRKRAKLERQAEKLVPFSVSKRFDSMTDKQIMAEVIKFRNPKADLEGKSLSSIEGRFDSIVESLDDEGAGKREDAGRALMGLAGGRMDSEVRTDADPDQARRKMIADTTSLWKTEKFSAAKK